MTAVLEPDTVTETEPPQRKLPLPTRFVALAVAVWLGVTGVCLALIIYGLGPLLQNREQRGQLDEFRDKIDRAVGETQSLYGPAPVTKPVEFGSPIAILEIPRLKVQLVVIEGVDSSDTAGGPGHVPGTAGPGQPGNSAIVGRRLGYGASFRQLDQLAPGDSVVVTTTQGQSLYEVTESTRAPLNEDTDYGKTPGDQLTLVTTSSRAPWASGEAILVRAKMRGLPYVPTPQNGRADAEDGRTGEGVAAVARLLLAALAFVIVGFGAVLLYRRWRPLATYVLTAPALVATCVLAAEAVSAILPAWI
ncbi:sortase A [Herbihabitans rhizosphaerae]|uniref:Sortase A n=1 Tax=Herbihabitans rhizosphaerae TaxID=1872711 RepID=A0A4Q7KL58_9PSEU|nr:class E sortase [Herbihabitans rhizosphaerae]RZS36966.1 sortase A [Herbihabitans rhizosphaerae]